MAAEGYHMLPPGKLANAVTWLEIRDPRPAGLAPPPGLALRRLGPEDAALFHRLYREIGRDWLWAGLLALSERELAERLSRPDLLSFAAEAQGRAAALMELVLSADGLEVFYFGVVPDMTGRGIGAWLMDEAKRAAREAGQRRLWLHTCSFDHPQALAFYRRQGFRPYAVGYEIMDDPRALGLLPEDAAPHVPFVRPEPAPAQ